MEQQRHLLVGGLIAMGFDATGLYLLTISHSGRGVYSTSTWKRVARDVEVAYPVDGRAIGIGPIEGESIVVAERNETQGPIMMTSLNGEYLLLGESDGVTITRA